MIEAIKPLKRFLTFITAFIFIFSFFFVMQLECTIEAHADVAALAISSLALGGEGTLAADGTVTAACVIAPEVVCAIAVVAIAAGVVYTNRQQILSFIQGAYNFNMALGHNISSEFIKNADGTVTATAQGIADLHQYINSVNSKVTTTAHYYINTESCQLGIGGSATFNIAFTANETRTLYLAFYNVDNKGSQINTASLYYGTTLLKSGLVQFDYATWLNQLDNPTSVAPITITTTDNSMTIVGTNNSWSDTFSNLTFPVSLTVPITNNSTYKESTTEYVSTCLPTSVGKTSAVPTTGYLNPALPTTGDAVIHVPANPTWDGLTGDVTGTITSTIQISSSTDTSSSTAIDLSPSTDTIDWSPLENIKVFDKFPFSIPWDLKNIVSSLVATPEAPKWVIDIPMSSLHLPDFAFTIDFSQYEVPVKVIRWGFLLIFTGGLAFVAYKLIKH